jgi:hypothetical protein
VLSLVAYAASGKIAAVSFHPATLAGQFRLNPNYSIERAIVEIGFAYYVQMSGAFIFDRPSTN